MLMPLDGLPTHSTFYLFCLLFLCIAMTCVSIHSNIFRFPKKPFRAEWVLASCCALWVDGCYRWASQSWLSVALRDFQLKTQKNKSALMGSKTHQTKNINITRQIEKLSMLIELFRCLAFWYNFFSPLYCSLPLHDCSKLKRKKRRRTIKRRLWIDSLLCVTSIKRSLNCHLLARVVKCELAIY